VQRWLLPGAGQRPVLILADEPTATWIPLGRGILALLVDLHRQGSTIVMVTHADEIATHRSGLSVFGMDHRYGSPNGYGCPQSQKEATHAGDKVTRIAWKGLLRTSCARCSPCWA